MGLLGHMNDRVTLVNRTIGAGDQERDLNVRYDGEDMTLIPGDNPGIPEVVVSYAKKQNPLMGSMHPMNPAHFICLVGVKTEKGGKPSKDDCTPLSRETLLRAAGKYEVLDRDGEHWDEPMENKVELKRKKKTYNAFEARVASGGFDGAPTGGRSE